MRSFIFVISLLIAGVCSGQVTAIVTGPKESDPGDLVVLDASGSTATAFRWVLLGSKKTYLTFDGGKRLVFASGQPGEYTFILVTAGQSQGGALDVATAEHILRIGDFTPPNPPVPPVPNPVPVVTTKSPKTILIWYESRDVSTTFTGTLVKLRSEQKFTILSPKNQILILDDDLELPAETNPSVKTAIEKAKAEGTPCIVAVDQTNNSVIASRKLNESNFSVTDLESFFRDVGVTP